MFGRKNYGAFTVDQLCDALSTQVVKIGFVKANGSERVMFCTMRPELCPLMEEGSRFSRGTLTVWDLEVRDWRSIRADRVYRVTLVPDSRFAR